MENPKGIDAWLDFIKDVRSWCEDKPQSLVALFHFDVENVHYDDLAAIAAHFSVEHEPENYKHKQSVEIDLKGDDLEGDFTIIFYSPARAFYYADIEA